MRERRAIYAVAAGVLSLIGATWWPTSPVSAAGEIAPGGRVCFDVAGSPGDLAVVNLTPVQAQGAGNGQLVSSDIANPPTTSNVNFAPGTVDPNVAMAPIGGNGRVCYVNSRHTRVHLVADHLATINADVVTLARSNGAPRRVIDTRQSGGKIAPSSRRCFNVAGPPDDVAVVNLTPVQAEGGGNGQLISSDIANPPNASNVNFRRGSTDPNVAMAPIGTNGRVCFANSRHTRVHLVADHLATIDADAVALARPNGAPRRTLDTRSGSKIPPSGRRCFNVAGQPGDVAVVNLTPVQANGAGDGLLVPSDVQGQPTASNVNFNTGTTDPNVALTRIGSNRRVCFVNSDHNRVHLVADHLATIAAARTTTATATGAPLRTIDTRNTGTLTLLDQLVIAPQNTAAPYNRDDWPHWIDADSDCKDTRAEVLIRDTNTSVTFTNTSNCTVATGEWDDPWTGLTFTNASDVDIDHTVALANAHRSGGWSWSTALKRQFANDLTHPEALRAMEDSTNSAKGARGPEAWKPPLTSSWCDFASDWATIKVRWGLTVTSAEFTALDSMLDTCDGPPPPPPPTTTTTTTMPTECDPAYPDPGVCIPPPPPDLDCADIPYRDFTVLPPDPHNFDGNSDGIGCVG